MKYTLTFNDPRESIHKLLRKKKKVWVPHIHKEGSRQHVLSYHGNVDINGQTYATVQCSEPTCEYNEPIKKVGGNNDKNY